MKHSERSGTVRTTRPKQRRWRELGEVCAVCGAEVGKHCRMGRRTKASSHLVPAYGREPVIGAVRLTPEDCIDPGVPEGHAWNQRWLWGDMPPK